MKPIRSSGLQAVLVSTTLLGACATFSPPARDRLPTTTPSETEDRPAGHAGEGPRNLERTAKSKRTGESESAEKSARRDLPSTQGGDEAEPVKPGGIAAAKKAKPEPPAPDLEAVEAEFKAPVQTVGACEGAPRAKVKKTSKLIWPVEGVVVSGFGGRDGAAHDGIDIGAPVGTPIWASRDGEVLYSGERSGYGQIVILGHGDGTVTVYAHNAKNCVPEKKRVTQGDVIALVGVSGGATSPAVHFEVRVGSKSVNPRSQLPD